MRRLLICIVIAVASVVATLVICGGYALISDSFKRPSAIPVAFSELLTEIDAGRVEEIRIQGRTYIFRTNAGLGKPGLTRETIGPRATSADANALRPANPSLPAPKLVFE